MNTALLLIILIPLVEIYLFIKIGSQIGAFNTISLILLTALLGVWYARYEGFNTLKSGISQIMKNEVPLYEIVSGAALAIAALMLILPGFATDLIGLLLIFPLSRKLILGRFANKYSKKNKNDNNEYIDGESEELDDKNKKMNKFKILLNFIKDISVETPDAETLIFVRDNISKYVLNIDITSKPLKNKMIEINTKLNFGDKQNNDKQSVFEIIYASVVRIDESVKDKKVLEKIILCDVQKEIYPKLEEIFTKLINDAGFPGLKFEKKVDFEKLYNERLN